jgi:hypothetical protein
VKLKALLCIAGLTLGLFGVAPRASAETITLGFDVIPSTSSSSARAAESQFQVQVTDDGVGPGQALFTFLNVGTIASSICDIYFQDGTLLGLAEIINQTTPTRKRAYLTYFSEGANPKNLPGGQSITPAFSPIVGVNFFSLDSNSPTQHMGINPGERLGVLFNLQPGRNFQSVKQALATLPPSTTANPSLRIGIHVQAIGQSGQSASYINERPTGSTTQPPPPAAAVPLPATVWAGLSLLGGVGAKRMWRRKPITA